MTKYHNILMKAVLTSERIDALPIEETTEKQQDIARLVSQNVRNMTRSFMDDGEVKTISISFKIDKSKLPRNSI